MNLALWIIAGLLAAGFLITGTTKLFIPRQKPATAPGVGWVNDFSARFVKTLGAVELLGAVGLIVPGALGIAPVLTPLAAIGLAIIMVGAAVVTLRRHEPKHALGNLALLALAVLIAFGRFGLVPFRQSPLRLHPVVARATAHGRPSELSPPHGASQGSFTETPGTRCWPATVVARGPGHSLFGNVLLVLSARR